MKLIRETLALGFVGLIAMLTGSGCAEDQSTIFIQAIMVPQPPDCVVQASPTGLQRSQGILDVGLRTDYSAMLLVGNQLLAQGSVEKVRTETARVMMQGAEVRLTTVDGTTLRAFTVNLTGFVDPSTSSTPGYGVMSVVMIPPDVGQEYAAKKKSGTVIAYVKVFGHTLGGTSVQSGEIQYPIAICRGCLVRFPQDAVDPTAPQPNCGLKGDTQAEKSCALGQDQDVDCRQCVTQYAVCAGQ